MYCCIEEWNGLIKGLIMKIKNDKLEHCIRINYKKQSYLHLSRLSVGDNDLVSVVDFLNKNPEIQEVDLSSNLTYS